MSFHTRLDNGSSRRCCLLLLLPSACRRCSASARRWGAATSKEPTIRTLPSPGAEQGSSKIEIWGAKRERSPGNRGLSPAHDTIGGCSRQTLAPTPPGGVHTAWHPSDTPTLPESDAVNNGL